MKLIDADLIEYHEIYDGHEFTQVAYADDISDLPTVCDIEQMKKEIIDYFLWDGQSVDNLPLYVRRVLNIIEKYTKGDSHESHKADD